MPNKSKLIFVLIFLGYVNSAYADMLYLKNGRFLEGIVKSEDNERVEFEICSGSVKFERSKIDKIITSSASEQEQFRQRCKQQKDKFNKQALIRKQEYERRPKVAELTRRPGGIMVETVLNKRLTTALILDTGASLTLIRKDIAQQLGIDTSRIKANMLLTLADGRTVSGKQVNLAHVKVGKTEAENVAAVVLLEEAGNLGSAGGLLGMSFLNRFSFKVDYQNKKLTLE
jgi:clan AA aspartic protease (TIGR02281 family)